MKNVLFFHIKVTTILSCTFYFVLAQPGKVFPDRSFVLSNAQIVDVVNESIFNGHIIIRNGQIGEVLSLDDTIPEGLEKYDMEGKFLLPGMIDAHTHLNNLAAAQRALNSGVTTVRSASVPAYQDVAIHRLAAEGKIPGPDMIPCGVYVTPHLGETILADPRLATLYDKVDEEEELRHLVRINVDRGAQVIKTRGTERAGLPETDPRQQTYSREQLSWVVDEATKLGVPVMIHAHGDEGARAAVEAGARSIEHGTYLSRETLVMMKEKDVFLVPTYITLLDLVEPGGDYDNPVILMRGKYMIPKSQATIKTALELGVKIATGADNRYTEESTSRVSMEVEEFIGLGMNPWEALRTTTVYAAELLEVSDRTGKIEVGLEADLVLVEDNPITEPKALQDVLVVISNGHIVMNRLPFGIKE